MSFDRTFDDGAHLSVDAQNGQVSVFQGSGSTQGRGAARLSPDDADAFADAVKAAAEEARKPVEAEEPAAAEAEEPAAAEAEEPAAAEAEEPALVESQETEQA